MFCPCYQPTCELRVDPADGMPHTKRCFLEIYGKEGAQKWATAAPWPGLFAVAQPEAPAASAAGAVKRKGKGEPKRKVKAGGNNVPASRGVRKRNPVTGSRGGGREPQPGMKRKKVHIHCDNAGIPHYTLTAGAEKDVEIFKDALACATDIDTSPLKPHQPFFGVHSFKMREDIVYELFPNKKTRRSKNQFFSQMGFRYKTVDGIKEFTFNVECYKANGWKVHQGSGTTAPELVFQTPPS